MTGSLPVDKHVVGDVDGAPHEGDTAVQRHMQKDFGHLLLRETAMQRPTNVAAQGAFTPQRCPAWQRTQAATGPVEARTRPGSTLVVFAGDAVKGPFRLSQWCWPCSRWGAHILHPQLGASLEQAVGVFGDIVDTGWRECDPAFFEHVFAQSESIEASRSTTVPGVVDNQLDNLFRGQANMQRVAEVSAQLGLAGRYNECRQDNYLALHWTEGVTVPDSAEERFAKQPLEIGSDVPGAGR